MAVTKAEQDIFISFLLTSHFLPYPPPPKSSEDCSCGNRENSWNLLEKREESPICPPRCKKATGSGIIREEDEKGHRTEPAGQVRRGSVPALGPSRLQKPSPLCGAGRSPCPNPPGRGRADPGRRLAPALTDTSWPPAALRACGADPEAGGPRASPPLQAPHWGTAPGRERLSPARSGAGTTAPHDPPRGAPPHPGVRPPIPSPPLPGPPPGGVTHSEGRAPRRGWGRRPPAPGRGRRAAGSTPGAAAARPASPRHCAHPLPAPRHRPRRALPRGGQRSDPTPAAPRGGEEGRPGPGRRGAARRGPRAPSPRRREAGGAQGWGRQRARSRPPSRSPPGAGGGGRRRGALGRAWKRRPPASGLWVEADRQLCTTPTFRLKRLAALEVLLP